jgi:MFS family permease
LKTKINREVKILSIAFMLIFLGYASVQQFVTAYFDEQGSASVGFRSLVIIYGSFFISNFFSSFFVSRFGAKRVMIVSSVFYSLYILSLLTNNVFCVYIFSFLLGISAGLLWTAHGSYFVRASKPEEYGRNSGFCHGLQVLGPAAGILILGVLISWLSFIRSFFIFSLVPVIGICFLCTLKDIKSSNGKSCSGSLLKPLLNTTALRISSFGFVFSFMQGLVYGRIPLEIKDILGVAYIGPLTSLTYLIPLLFSSAIGKFSDRIGRQAVIKQAFLIMLLGLICLHFSEYGLVLILSVLLISVAKTIAGVAGISFTGDVTVDDNLDTLSAFFCMTRALGASCALLLSCYCASKLLYTISAVCLIAVFFFLRPVLTLSLDHIKDTIRNEKS